MTGSLRQSYVTVLGLYLGHHRNLHVRDVISQQHMCFVDRYCNIYFISLVNWQCRELHSAVKEYLLIKKEPFKKPLWQYSNCTAKHHAKPFDYVPIPDIHQGCLTNTCDRIL